MRKHSNDKIKAIRNLRSRGCSINEISSSLSVPKTTVWNHIQKVKIPPKFSKILDSKRGGSRLKKLARLESARESALELLKGKNRFIVGVLASLYWAEGNKREMTFTNTDPLMIRLYISLIREIFGLEDTSIKVIIRYFTDMNKYKCLSYWSEVTGISKSRIYMYYNDGGNRGKSPYGICRIYTLRGGHILKIIQALAVEITKMPPSFNG